MRSDGSAVGLTFGVAVAKWSGLREKQIKGWVCICVSVSQTEEAYEFWMNIRSIRHARAQKGLWLSSTSGPCRRSPCLVSLLSRCSGCDCEIGTRGLPSLWVAALLYHWHICKLPSRSVVFLLEKLLKWLPPILPGLGSYFSVWSGAKTLGRLYRCFFCSSFRMHKKRYVAHS